MGTAFRGKKSRPEFKSVQVDYTELPQVGHLKYLLVIVDHLTNWVEAMPLSSTTTNEVV
jgi:hypothetical protein